MGNQVLDRIPVRRRSLSETTPSPDSGRVSHSLRMYPAFRMLMLGTLATNSAFWMYQVCVGWLALQLMDSPLFVGLTCFVGGIPVIPTNRGESINFRVSQQTQRWR